MTGIADLGGLFGLFLGFSFPTIIHFIYKQFEAHQTRKNKIKTLTVKSKKITKNENAWAHFVDSRENIENLLAWQENARKRARVQRSNLWKMN